MDIFLFWGDLKSLGKIHLEDIHPLTNENPDESVIWFQSSGLNKLGYFV